MTGAELHAARKRLGLSAEALARMLGVSGARTVYRWERDEAPIPGPIVRLLDLAERLPAARALLERASD